MRDGLTDLLLFPLQLDFMIQALSIALALAVPAAILSCFLVLKGWSLMGDAMSHAVLPGVVLAYIVGAPLAVGAFLAGLGCAVAVGYLDANSRVKRDTILGVVFSGMFGLGLVLYAQVQSEVHLDHILFGDMLGVGWTDIAQTGAIGAVVTVLVLAWWKDLLLHSFDPAQAQATGLPVRALHYGLLVALALTIVAALKAVGIILAIALLIAPGATAFLVTRRFDRMMVWAVTIAILTSVLGVYSSFFIDSAPAPTIVLLMTLAFIAAFVASRRRVARNS